ncbi:spore coat protein H [Mesobacillus persicus]|uniref:Spore coat protein H n=1 Tax=Mesobacillus persicus TaxID=930146 RepID=A0A1H8EZZ5_9BACI|nr:CotH kinase family protein [Mesobacillus persicus]SEN24457.1 spore coat protein H [Mesobacillus persicus]
MKDIPLYNLYIDPLDFKELQRDVWIDDPVPANLIIDRNHLDIDITYRGSHIREFEKKSYNIQFYNPPRYQRAKEIHLNAEFNDPSLIRNKLSLDFFSEIGCLSPESKHVFLGLNGKAHGVYLELESVDEHFLAKRKLPTGSIYYAINGNANFSLKSGSNKGTKKSLVSGYQKKVGNRKDDRYLKEMIFKINTISKAEFGREVEKVVNVEKYLRWLAGVVLTQNYDGFVHNYALYRNGDSGRFEMIPWDYDATWGRDVHGRVLRSDYVPIDGFNTLTARILDVDDFRKKYQRLLIQLLNTHFTIEHMTPKVEGLVQQLHPYIVIDPYTKHAIKQFEQEPHVIYDYIKNRRKFISEQLYKLS